MAVKRIFSAQDAKHRTCLSCAAPLPLEDMKDDTICACKICGQEMTVDRNGDQTILTVIERRDIRRRMPKHASEALTKADFNLLQEIERLEKELSEKEAEVLTWQQEAKKWEQIADELALELARMSKERRNAQK